MMKKLLMAGGALVLLLVPAFAFAQPAGDVDSIPEFAQVIIDIINNVLVPLILTIAFLVFIWGVFRFFIAGGEEAKTEGKNLIIYGLIGFFVILSVWGLVNVLVGTFGFSNTRTPEQLPEGPNVDCGFFGLGC